MFKNNALKDRIGFAKAYGMPLRVGKYEPGASRADRAAGIIYKSTEIEFIEARKGSSQDRGRRV